MPAPALNRACSSNTARSGPNARMRNAIRAASAIAAATRRTGNAHHPFSNQYSGRAAHALDRRPAGREPVRRHAGDVSAEDRTFYVSEVVGAILAEQFRKLCVKPGEPVEITKAEVSRGNGRKGIQWMVAKVGFAPGEQPNGTFAVPKAEPST